MSRITVYGYHPSTLEALPNPLTADESPLEPGVYHLPEFTTQTPVPELKANQAAVYDAETDGWGVVPNFRGLQVYSTLDGSTAILKKLGDIPDGCTTKPRPSEAYDWDQKAQDWVINQEKQDELNQAAERAKVPAFVTMRQARLVLYHQGLYAQVQTLMSHPDTPEDVKIEWEFAAVVRRESPQIAGLAKSLGLSDKQIDQLFIQAATFE